MTHFFGKNVTILETTEYENLIKENNNLKIENNNLKNNGSKYYDSILDIVDDYKEEVYDWFEE